MLISFRQTYGDNRLDLYDILLKDKKLLELYNLCDFNIQSFHNCSNETINYYKNIIKIKNSIYLEFNNITYGECIIELKKKLKELNATHFLWTQDDTFSDKNDHIDWRELIEYISKYKENLMINLGHSTAMVNSQLKPDEKFKSFNVYHLSTEMFKYISFPMDDSSYICSIDMIDEIYDDEYCSIEDVWNAERHLQRKYRIKEIPRYLISDIFIIFKNYNIIGRTIGKKEKNIQKLIEKGFYTIK